MARLVSALLVALTVSGCGAPTAAPCATSTECEGGGTCIAGACAAAGQGGGGGAGGGAGGSGGGLPVHRIVGVELSPTSLALAVGQEAKVTALGRYDDGSLSDVSGTVAWSLSPSGPVDVVVRSAGSNDVALRALGPGAATVTAKVGTLVSNALTVTVALAGVDAGAGADGGTAGPASAEVRAVWVTRFGYATAQDVRTVIANAANAGFNVVFFQIRGAGDAFYASTKEPWSAQLTGTLGKDPGWDPLQVAITEAHARGLQLHAYFNVFSAWRCPSTGSCTCAPATSCQLPGASFAGAPTHWLQAHPEAMAVNSSGDNADTEYLWFSPGDLAYRAHLLDTARELLTTYAVDGLHLDRVRYPGSWASYDPASNAAFAALPSPRPARADWQRQQVADTVSALYDVVKQVRPGAVLSASVWGIHTRLPGCSTSEGSTQYFQDSKEWVSSARIDWIVPMIYWDIGTGCTDWTKLLQTFTGSGRAPRVVAGMHALDTGTVQPAKLRARIEVARANGTAGTCVFASSYLNGAVGWSSFRADGGVFAADAGVPPVTWR